MSGFEVPTPTIVVDRLEKRGVVERYLATDTTSPSSRIEVIALPDTNDASADAFGSVARDWERISSNSGTATIVDRGTDPRPWIAFESGGTKLDEYEGNLSTEGKLRLVLSVANTLREAERYNVRHLELSPDCIRIQEDGHLAPVVTGWGIESAVQNVTENDRPVTPYTAPEQIDPERFGGVGARTEVYRLGALMHYVITGDPPFDHGTEGLSQKICDGDEAVEEASLSSLQNGVKHVITRSLRRDPNDRFESISTFRDELENVIDSVTEPDADEVKPTDKSEGSERLIESGSSSLEQDSRTWIGQVLFRSSRRIDRRLPAAATYMYALALEGKNLNAIIEEMATAESAYGAVSREFQRIIKSADSSDYRSAVRACASETPSDEFASFLRDLLAVPPEGPKLIDLLEDRRNKLEVNARIEGKRITETLQFFCLGYVSVLSAPVLLMIVLLTLQMMGQMSSDMIVVAAYGSTPVVALLYLGVVGVPASRWVGRDRVRLDGGTDDGFRSLVSGETYKGINVFREPHIFFRENPLYSLVLTVPAAVTVVGVAIVSGAAPTAWGGPQNPNSVMANPVWGTFVLVHLPLLIVLIPFAIFYEWNARIRDQLAEKLPDEFRKMAEASDGTQSLRELTGSTTVDLYSLSTEETEGSDEETLSKLRSLTNRCERGRIVRAVKVIVNVDNDTENLPSILISAARTAEHENRIVHEYRSATRKATVIISATFLTVSILLVFVYTDLINVLAGLVENVGDTNSATMAAGSSQQSLTGDIKPNKISMMFFHLISLQAIVTGALAGYVQYGSFFDGAKYTAAYLIVSLVMWGVFVG